MKTLRPVAVLDRDRLLGGLVDAADPSDLEGVNRVSLPVQLEGLLLEKVPERGVVSGDVPEGLERREAHLPELVKAAKKEESMSSPQLL